MTGKKGKYDKRNQLNDLTGKEWLKLTKSFWLSEKCKEDKAAFLHPAPFLIKDIEKLISMFTKKGMTVLDPFVGSGKTIIAANNLGRKSIGIDLNKDYQKLAYKRFKENDIKKTEYKFVIADSTKSMLKLGKVDYVVTSPPYHNILRNTSEGIRADKSKKGYRNGSRQGIVYYSDDVNDLGNQKTYAKFLALLTKVFQNVYNILNDKKYCSIIMSDFTINKTETCVQGDIVNMMTEIGYEFCGTTVLLQDNKPLYPFGYPYSYKINHMHQNIMNFRRL